MVVRRILNRWHPRTAVIAVGVGVLILVAVVAFYMFQNFQPETKVKIGSSVFTVQIASTDAARLKGLSGVNYLDSRKGLLLVFQGEDEWGIWMKDMKIPLDIIWINNDKKIIYIVNDALPQLGMSTIFTPESPARYVLEVPAGSVKTTGIIVGSTAVFNVMEAH